jgi:hypothetical protein
VAPVLTPEEMAAHQHFRTRQLVVDAGDGSLRLGFAAQLLHHPSRPPGELRPVGDDRDDWS